MIKQILLVSALAVVAYIVLLPVPQEIEKPWTLKMITLVMKVVSLNSMEEPSSMLNSNNNLILAHDVMSLKQRATSL